MVYALIDEFHQSFAPGGALKTGRLLKFDFDVLIFFPIL